MIKITEGVYTPKQNLQRSWALDKTEEVLPMSGFSAHGSSKELCFSFSSKKSILLNKHMVKEEGKDSKNKRAPL